MPYLAFQVEAPTHLPLTSHPHPHPHTRCQTVSLHNFVDLFTPKETRDSKHSQSRRDTPEPPQIVDFLAGDFDVHAPHAADDVHWQNDCAYDLLRKELGWGGEGKGWNDQGGCGERRGGKGV